MSRTQAFRVICIMLAVALVLTSALAFAACGKDKPTEYTVTFYVDGAVYDTVTTDGTAITLPAAPTKEGYTFAGWYLDEAGLTAFAQNNITGNVSVYAAWTANTEPQPTPASYTITFVVDGAVYDAKTLTSGTTVTLPAAPTKDGYTFDGWYLDEAGTKAYTAAALSADLRVYAHWTAVVVTPTNYTVTFVVNGNTYRTKEATVGTAITLPDDPDVVNYRFDGWYLDEAGTKAFDPAAISADTTVYARMTPAGTGLALEGFSRVGAEWQQTVAANVATIDFAAVATIDAGSRLEVRATEDGQTLADTVALQPGANTFYLTVVGVGSMTKYTVRVRRTIQYTVSFDTKGANATVEAQVVDENTKATSPIFNGTRAGYRFDGWDFDFETDITADITVSARWTLVDYTINYDLAGGNATNPTVYTVESTAITLAAPTREGYTFVGWTGTGLDAATVAVTIAAGSTGDRMYTAHWSGNAYTIYLDPNHDDLAKTAAEVHMGVNYTLTPVQRDNYQFAGWYVGDVAYTDAEGNSLAAWADVVADGSMFVLTAKWAPRSYRVLLDVEGGTLQGSDQAMLAYNEHFTLEVPTRTGYDFVGWRTDAGDYYTDNKGASTRVWDKTNNTWYLYAQWSAHTTLVVFDADQGSPVTALNLNYGETYQLPTSIRTYCDFVAWAIADTERVVTDDQGNGLAPWAEDVSSLTLKAIWKPSTHTVSFNLNGGSGTIAAVSITNNLGEWPKVDTSSLTKTGHTFGGFYRLSDEHQMYNAAGDPTHQILLDEDLTVYARWTPNTYTITFDPTEGSTAYTSATVTYGDIPAGLTEAQLPTLDEYTFAGYFDAANGGNKYFNRDGSAVQVTYAIAGDITLYAQWKNGIYTVRYYANIPENAVLTGNMPGQDIELHVTTALAANAFACEGYTFAGWNTAADGTGTPLADKAEVLDKAANAGYFDLYAQWSANTYTVTAGDTTKDIDYNTAFALGAPSRDGYTFDGWAYNGNLVTDNKGDGAAWRIAADVTLTAQFTAITYTVTLMANGESAGTIDVTYDSYVLGKVNGIPLRTGYTFAGYYTVDGTGGVRIYDANGNSTGILWTYTAQTALYAQWTANSYFVGFNPGNGACYEEGFYVDFGTYPKDVTPSNFRYTGYTFKGLVTADGTKQYYDEDGHALLEWAEPWVTVLQVVWEKTPYTVTFDYNGGEQRDDAPDTVTIHYEDLPFSFPVPKDRTGYTFDGWYVGDNKITDANGDGLAKWIYTEGKEVVAKWVGKYYTVSFNEDGGDYQHSNVKAQYGKGMPHLSTVSAKDGYTLLGYDYNGTRYYSVDGGYFQSAHDWDLAEDVTLVAQWQPKTYRIYFQLNSGSMDATDEEQQAIRGTYMAALPTLNEHFIPTRTNYVFDGWADIEGNYYYNSTLEPQKDKYDVANYVYLYAKWHLDTLTVVLDANGGSGDAMDNMVITRNYGQTMSTNTYTRDGYTFAGWNTAADGSGTAYAYNAYVYANDLAPWPAKTITLYAQWNGITYTATLRNAEQAYTVSFDLNGASGVAPADQVVTADVGLVYPDLPERDGYLFTGWYDNEDCDGDPFVFNKTVKADITLYACWVQVAEQYSPTPILPNVAYDIDVNYETKHYYAVCAVAGGSLTITVAGKYSYISLYQRGNYAYKNIGAGYTVTLNKGEVLYFYIQAQNNNGWADYYGDTTFTVTHSLPADGGKANLDRTMDVVFGNDAIDYGTADRTGYTFAGWYDGEGGTGTQYANADGKAIRAWDVVGNATLYAGWTPNVYNISFAMNDGTPQQADVTATFDAAMSKAGMTLPTKDDYDFAGYYTLGGTKYYNADLSSARNWDIAADTILYAHWVGKEYTVVFNANAEGVTGAMDDQILHRNTDEALALNAFTKAGYSFAGWATAADGAVAHTDGKTVKNLTTAGASITLYAKWTANGYKASLDDGRLHDVTVTFDLNGATGEPPAAQVLAGETGLDYPDIPARSGYLFGGWYDNAAGTGAPYDFAAAQPADITLYAKWVAIPDGEVGWSMGAGTYDASVDAGVTVKVMIVPLTTALYVYSSEGTSRDTAGYLYDSKKSQLLYDDDGKGNGQFLLSYTVTPGAVYYVGAKFYDSSNSGTITLHATGIVPADGGLSSNTIMGVDDVTYDDDFTLSIPAARTHYTFDGWYDGEGGTGNKLTGADGVGLAWTIASNTTLYARWVGEKHAVSFDYNGGSGSQSAVQAEYGAAMPALSGIPTKDNRVFMGYFSAAVDGVQYYDAEGNSVRSSDLVADTTLYAQWANQPYYVVYHANAEGVTGEMATQLIRRDISTALTTGAYTRTGYSFMGWNTDKDSTEVLYANEQSVTNIAAAFAELDLYAIWKATTTNVKTRIDNSTKRNVTVTFDLNGADGEAPAAQVVEPSGGATLQYPADVPERDGYLFAGWYDNAAGTGSPYYFGNNGIDYDITLYAKWVATENVPIIIGKTYTIEVTDDEVYYSFYLFSRDDDAYGYIPITVTVGKEAYIKNTNLNYYGNGTVVIEHAYNNESFTSWTLLIHSKNYSTDPAYTGTTTLKVSLGDGVKFWPNGGRYSDRVDIERKVLTYDQPFSLQTVSKANFDFMGWYTSTDGNGIQITDADGNGLTTWNIEDSSKTLYAYFRGVECNITFDKQGGTGGSDSAKAYYSTGFVGSSAAPSRTGYDFVGYFDGEGGTGTQYLTSAMTSNHMWDKTTDTTLYAYWTPKQTTVVLNDITKSSVTVSFNLNGASGDAPPAQVLSNSGLTYPDIPTRSGYLFAGWYTDSACTELFDHWNEHIYYDYTLYAKWIAIPDWADGCQTISVGGDAVDVAIDGKTYRYYAFTVLVSANYTMTTTGELDTYGVLYQANQYQVISADYGGTGDNFGISRYLIAGNLYVVGVRDYYDAITGTASLTVTRDGGAETIPSTEGSAHNSDDKEQALLSYDSGFSLSVPTKDGYVFQGWYTEEDGQGDQITDETGASVAAWALTVVTKTLYAYWVAE